jgi:hypothetical protein
MTTTYRGIVDSNGVLIAFGVDFGQSGDYDNGSGTWCDFTFTEFPEILAVGEDKMLFKVVDGAVVARTQEEVDAE